MEKEIMEYLSLCAVLRDLHKKILIRKQQLRLLLEETAARKKEALLILVKENRITRYLTGRQRQTSGLSYHLCEIKIRINRMKVIFPEGCVDQKETLPVIREDCRNRKELRKEELLILGLIDDVKKKLLQLDLLELRCHELIISIKKALEAFQHESKIIKRRIYPFGVFSFFRRFLRSLFGKTFFTYGELDDIAVLGNITCSVLKIADSSVI
jgi:hypothetical protein